MSDMPKLTDFEPEVAAGIARFLFERAQPLMIEFDKEWQWVNLHGDPARFGFDPKDPVNGTRQLQDLFLGMALDESIDLPFVQMPNGRSAHVHLVVNNSGFQVLLLDAQVEHDRQQAQQQTGNEAVLVGYQKSKAIAQLRQIRTELESQRTRLQEANALKNALIATLSHDFRTPLTSIFGYLHLLEVQAVKPEVSNSLRALRRNANYLFTLAENLLEYARADNRSSLLAPQALDLSALIEDLDAMFRPLAIERGLDFTIDVDVPTDVVPILDELRLRQILVNLLSNAVRYTEKGSVGVGFGWDDAALSIEVRDTGIGIAEEFHDKVFVAFNRTSQAPGSGAGLGLSIVKRLVAQMLGVLDFQSIPGEGTRFRIVLPNFTGTPEHAGGAITQVPDAADKRIRHVLVVDDDPDIAHLLEVLLGELGFRVSIVGDAAAAVERAMADRPDILLVDVELPGLSGNTAVFRLRSQGYKGHIVTLSATPTEEARKVALNAGADQYLTKPLNIEEFSRVMQRAAQAR
ncbi:ATP-binding protein [Dokdonella sp.]|uniref:ATP-binding response regulator n=1 Tax=Dokdonella sp. TaxID=2291710 RepID=UPI003C33502D